MKLSKGNNYFELGQSSHPERVRPVAPFWTPVHGCWGSNTWGQSIGNCSDKSGSVLGVEGDNLEFLREEPTPCGAPICWPALKFDASFSTCLWKNSEKVL